MEERQKEAENAMEIVQQEVTKFNDWFSTLDAVPTIVEMRNRAEVMRKSEVDKTLKTLTHLSADDQKAVHQLTQSLVNKILHKPTINLKKKTQIFQMEKLYFGLLEKCFGPYFTLYLRLSVLFYHLYLATLNLL